MLKEPQGSDLTIMNTMYIYPRRDQQTGKYSKPVLEMVYKDNRTGQKKLAEIENPDYEFYITNDNVNVEYNQLFIPKDQIHKVNCKYGELEKTIAELTGNLEFFYDNLKNKNGRANKFLHTHPKVFMSDTNIEDHYRFRFSNLYQNNIIPVTKSYFDIEADTINMRGDFPELGECPINAVSIIFEHINKTYTFLLRNPDNPLIQQFENSINSNLFVELKDFIRDAVGGAEKEIKFGLDKMEYEFIFYDEEIRLIQDLFILINQIQPDFVLAWNMAFDIPYIIERLKNLGYNPAEIMTHPDFKYKQAEYFVDERMRDLFAERGDFAYISSYSIFIDQLIQFASRRKSQSAFKSFRLDDIGESIVNVKKLNFKHITTDIAQLPYLDYKTFVFYNIMDTIVQKCIENKTADIDYIFGKCIINNTRYHKGHRQTVYLTNRGTKEFFNDGFVIGNNNNRGNEKPPKFPGALVGDPSRISDYAKIRLHGIPINVFDNLDDYDYKSLYPSIMREFNIAPHTQIGRVEINNPVHDKENRFNYEHYNRGGSFIDDLQTQSYLEFCTRWFHLGDYLSIIKDIEEYFTKVRISMRPYRIYNTNGRIDLIQVINPELKSDAIEFINKDHLRSVIDFYIPSDFTNIKKELNIC